MMFQEKFRKADINISAIGDNIVIAPGLGLTSGMPATWDNPGTFIAIDFITLIPSGNVTLQMKDGSTAYGGPLPLVASQPFVFENGVRNQHGIITLSPNNNFVINLSAAVQVTGFIRYRLLAEN